MRTYRPTLTGCAGKNRNLKVKFDLLFCDAHNRRSIAERASKLDGYRGNSVDPLWLMNQLQFFEVYLHGRLAASTSPRAGRHYK
jgi:hypothetical protein